MEATAGTVHKTENRLPAAKTIADRINEHDDYSAKVWSKNGNVRVYLRRDSGGKKGWIDAGQIDLNPDGTFETNKDATFAFRYDKEKLEAALHGIEFKSEDAEAIRPVAPREEMDEDELQMEESMRAAARRESSRELG